MHFGVRFEKEEIKEEHVRRAHQRKF